MVFQRGLGCERRGDQSTRPRWELGVFGEREAVDRPLALARSCSAGYKAFFESYRLAQVCLTAHFWVLGLRGWLYRRKHAPKQFNPLWR